MEVAIAILEDLCAVLLSIEESEIVNLKRLYILSKFDKVFKTHVIHGICFMFEMIKLGLRIFHMFSLAYDKHIYFNKLYVTFGSVVNSLKK